MPSYYLDTKLFHLYGKDNERRLSRLSIQNLFKLVVMTNVPIKKALIEALNKRDWK